MTRAFRPEFLNRLDRTVVFRPLSRPMMREILRASSRPCWRGAACAGASGRSSSTTRRSSSCSRGLHADLGARPLKRAVERHFLTPLALAIAGDDVPGRRSVPVRPRRRRGPEGHVRRSRRAGRRAGAPPASAGRRCARWPARATGALALLEEAYAPARPRRGPRVGRRRRPSCWGGSASRASGTTRAASPCSAAIELRDRIEAGLRSARLAAGPHPLRAPPAVRARPPRRPAAAPARRGARRA